MRDLMGLMGKAKEMQAKFQAMQEEMAEMEIEGQAGGGTVKVTLSGKSEMKALKIDPSLFKEDDVEILEDLILAAIKDAQGKATERAQEEMGKMTEGLGLPPGMNLPF